MEIISCILSFFFFFRMSKKQEQDANVTTFRSFVQNASRGWERDPCMERDPEPGPGARTGVRAMLAPPPVCNVTGTQSKIREPP